MQIGALKLVGYDNNCIPKQVLIDWSSKANFNAEILSEIPAVFIVKENTLDPLIKNFPGTFENIQTKSDKELSYYCMNKKKHPVVFVDYKREGQALRSLRVVYNTAHYTKDNNVYFIMVTEPFYEKLLNRCHASYIIDKTTAVTTDEEIDNSREWSIKQLLNMMDPYIVTDELKKTYVGNSIEIKLVHQQIMQAGKHKYPVLVLGETGTGKEKIAHAIHTFGNLNDKPFVAVNCAAIPNTLFESELFGYAKGSHSNAYFDKPGLWETAKDGTLFLDEIGDLDLDNQTKILRALEYGRFTRIGGTAEIESKARIIAATNRDLFAMTQNGSFREDLYYRLRQYIIYSPPLRHHKEDIPDLVHSIWNAITKDKPCELNKDVIKALQDYHWPGNVRMLKSNLISLYTYFGSQTIRLKHLEALRVFNHTFPFENGAKEPTASPWIKLEAIELLKRADSALDSIDNTIKYILGQPDEAKPELRDHLHHQIIEFVALLLQSVYLDNQTTLAQMKKLGKGLQLFVEYLKLDPIKGLDFWLSDVKTLFRQVHEQVLDDIEEIVKGY